MQQFLLITHVIAAVCIIALVLIQHGKGADAGAGFGSGASGTVFGSTGSTPFLVKITSLFALIFFITSLSMARLSAHAVVSTQQKRVDSILGAAPAAAKPITTKKSVSTSTSPKTGSKKSSK